MAANNNNAAARVPVASYQTSNDYPMPFQLELRSIPYVEARESLGIKLYTGPGWKTVWASEDNDGFRFNEADNTYGKRVTALTMQRAKQMMLNRGDGARGGTPPQTNALKEVLEEEITRLINAGSWDTPPDFAVSVRQHSFLHTVWGGFNSDDEFNDVLSSIATTYAELRLGLTPFQVFRTTDTYDELWTAIQACNIQLEVHERGATGGSGLWALPIVHALNLHLQHFTEIEPIAFHQEEGRDRFLIPTRDASTRRIWIMDPSEEATEDIDEGKINIAIESRPHVRTQLLSYLGLQEDDAGLPQEVAEPAEAPAAPAGPGRPIPQLSGTRRRRSQG